MSSIEIVSLIVTFLGVASFAIVFTILYSSYSSSSIKEIKSGKRDIELMDEMIYESQEKVIKRKKVSKKIRSIVLTLLMILIVPIFLFSLINKIQGNVTMIGNRSLMVVASGSMSQKNQANPYLIENQLDNQFNTYDMIFLSKVHQEADLQLYDVIAYKNNQGIHVIHRIIAIEEKDGKICYVTRGDANNASDAYQPTLEDVIGKYTGKRIKTIGIFVLFLQSYPGIITIFSLIYCLLMIDHFSSKMNQVQENRMKELSAAMGAYEKNSTAAIKTEFVEAIYYKDFVYIFDEQGFIEKRSLDEEKKHTKEEVAHTMIQVIKNKNTQEASEKYVVLEEEGVEQHEQ